MPPETLFSRILRYFLENKFVTALLLLAALAWGVYHAPFEWNVPGIDRSPLAVDAIPDIGENQQIVFAEWMGHSPRDVERQITLPLTSALLGLPGVRTVRGNSMAGMASAYVIFEEDVGFETARTRILEKLASLPSSALPAGVRASLGPDASPLGQVFWYTIEGVDKKTGEPLAAWTPLELRTIQDWQVKPALAAVAGISEVASIGGAKAEFQVQADPEKLAAHGVPMNQLFKAVSEAGNDADAGTIEVNRVEYYVRSLGAVRTLADLEETVVTPPSLPPVRVRDVARVSVGPANRSGALDRNGVEAAGGVAVVRYGENPLAAIKALKHRIAEISASLPEKETPDGRIAKAVIRPFYDRTDLIRKNLHTLSAAIRQQVVITVAVILLMLINLRAGLIVSGIMPISVLLCFVLMKRFGIDANLVSLSGIAISIGAISDMGIILCENVSRNLRLAPPGDNTLDVIHRSVREVAGAVTTAVATTLVGFLPVFAMTGPEGRMFRPLAYTKTFCLLAAIVVTLVILPAAAHLFLTDRKKDGRPRHWGKAALALALGILVFAHGYWLAGLAATLLFLWAVSGARLPQTWEKGLSGGWIVIAVLGVGALLASDWLPLGAGVPLWKNLAFVYVLIALVFLGFRAFMNAYPRLLLFALRHKALFLAVPLFFCLAGLVAWLGFARVFAFVPAAAERAGFDRTAILSSPAWVRASHAFPGLGKEFMPSLDEGMFLSMPTLMPHGSVDEAMELMQRQDRAFLALPEVAEATGKLGRSDSALDPAPVTMLETMIRYLPEYIQDEEGGILTFAFDPATDDVFRDAAGAPVLDDGKEIPQSGRFLRDEKGALIPAPLGRAFRQWRPRIRTADDLWREIETAGRLPGLTGAPRLHPIEARVVMLQTGIRAAMGVKILGPNLEAIDQAARDIEALLRQAPLVDARAVTADRAVGKPYLEIIPDRAALGAHGIPMANFQHFVGTAIGGMSAGTAYEGRERRDIVVRYQEDYRADPEALGRARVPTPDGRQIPLGEVAAIRYTRGPEMLGTENSFPVGYVVFDRQAGVAEVSAVEAARDFLMEKEAAGELRLPQGVSYVFTGSYENQVRSERKLMLILPLSLLIIFLLIYRQFRSASLSLAVFAGVPLAFSGGMLLLWLYGQDWFMAWSLFGIDLRELLQIRPYNLSVAVWVGFLALFGIASDDGVVMTSYLEQRMAEEKPRDRAALHAVVLAAGQRRVRPCLMTTATTLLALLPVLTSRGSGAEIMIPMAIPSFGGMALELLTMFMTPICYAMIQERRLKKIAKA